MIGKESVREELRQFVLSKQAEQPLLILSHSRIERELLCNIAKRFAVCKTSDACGTCNGCKQSDANAHPDTMSITGEKGRIRIKDISLVKTILANTSMKRVVCIPYAEDLLPEASNALLKTLEEPTKNTRFVLCAKSKRSILPTIRSRCKIITLHFADEPEASFSSQEVVRRLSDIRPAEPFKEEELTEISRLVHQMILEQGASGALFKVSLRLRDYYKTASFPGGNTKLAADILLASLANLRNTTK